MVEPKSRFSRFRRALSRFISPSSAIYTKPPYQQWDFNEYSERTFAESAPSARSQKRRHMTETDRGSVRTQPQLNMLGYMKNAVIISATKTYTRFIDEIGYKVHSDYLPTQLAIDRFHDSLDDPFAFKKALTHFNAIHLAIDGNAYLENLTASLPGGKKIINGASIVDFRTMDFIREDSVTSGDVLFDDRGRPVGWYQWVDGQTVTFNRDEMQHNTTGQTHPGERGIGFVESLIDETTLHLNSIHAQAELAFQQANIRPIVVHGDALKRSSMETRAYAQRVRDDLVNEDVAGIDMPNYLTLGQWPPRTDYVVPPEFTTHLMHLFAGVTGVPMLLLTQDSSGASEKTQEMIMDNFGLNVASFTKDLGLEEWYHHMLRFNGEPTRGLKIEWGNITDRMLKEESLRFLRMAKAGILPVDNEKVIQKAMEIAGVNKKSQAN